LDFSQMTLAIRQLLAGRSSVAALLNAVVQSPPKILNNQKDHKKDLDEALVKATETLVSIIVKIQMDNIISFNTKASVHKTATRQQLFGDIDQVKVLLEDNLKHLHENLSTILNTINLYLSNQHKIEEKIFSTLETNLLEIYSKFLTEIDEGGYTSEDKQRIGVYDKENIFSQIRAIFKSFWTPRN